MPTKEQWLKERKNYITASDVGAIFGFGFSGQSALTVYEDKISDEVEVIDDNPVFMAGHAMEGVASDIFEMMFPDEYVMLGDMNKLLIHPSVPFLACTRDRVIVKRDKEMTMLTMEGASPRPLEIKCMGLGHPVNRHEWKEDPPERQQLQLQIQMSCMNADSGVLFGLFVPGCEGIKVEKEFDDELFGMILPKLEKFWDCVTNRTPPDPKEFNIGSRELKRIYSTENRQTIALMGHAHEAATNWIRVKEEIKQLKSEEEEHKASLLAAMGENSYGALLDGTFIKRKAVNRKGYQPKYVEPSSYILVSHTGKNG